MYLSSKAKAQSKATVMALMDLKHLRRATFVKQANFAHGRNRSTMAQLLALIPRNTRRRARTRENLNPSKTNYWKQTMIDPAKGWTPERSKQQSRAIRRWKPWQQSTGPKSPEGRAVVTRNAWRRGHWMMLRQAVEELNDAMRGQFFWLK